MGYLKGHLVSKETRKKLAEGHLGENNGSWKGDSVGYVSLHEWIRKWKPKPDFCESCGKVTVKLDLVNVDHKYRRVLEDYLYLCRKCHIKRDIAVLGMKFGRNKKAKGKAY